MNIENAELNEGMLIIPQEDGSILCIPEEGATSDEQILFASWRELYPDGKPDIVSEEQALADLLRPSLRDVETAEFDIRVLTLLSELGVAL